MTKEELANFLKEIKGTTFCTIETETEPKLRGGKKCPYAGVKKISKVNGAVGFIYENSVNNQRVREDSEPDFESEPRRWGHRVNGTPLVEYNGKFYIEVKVEKTETPLYILNGKFVANEDITPYLPETTSRQGVEKEIILRDYSLDSIKMIKIKGQQFVISQEPVHV
jgi:hypothetical protein